MDVTVKPPGWSNSHADPASDWQVQTGSGNPFTPTTELRLNDLLALHDGEDDTPNMQAWKAERERETQAREQLGLVDLGAIMTHGVTPPEMLVAGLPFVVGVHTEMFGPKENGKTWLALWTMKELILRGEHVIWVDKEMGSNYMASRLIALGVEPEVVSDYFHYLDHPTFGGGKEPVARWEMLLDAMRPKMIVFDARTEFLADGGLNENLGSDVAKWDSWYLNPAARRGIATVMIDHVGHSEGGRQRGSGHKGNSAKVELQVDCIETFNKGKVGKLKITLRKNTHAAEIPAVQSWHIGGEAQDNGGWKFIFRRALSAQDKAKNATQRRRMLGIVQTMVDEQAFKPTDADAMSQNQIVKLTKGNAKELGDDLKALALDPHSPVKPYQDGKTAVRYYVDHDEAIAYLAAGGDSKAIPNPSNTEPVGIGKDE